MPVFGSSLIYKPWLRSPILALILPPMLVLEFRYCRLLAEALLVMLLADLLPPVFELFWSSRSVIYSI